MTSTPTDSKRPTSISDSWVDLSWMFVSGSGTTSPIEVPPAEAMREDYLAMLREAQKESCRSSNKVSPISSVIVSLNSTTRNTPSASPKSPPNSPNPELADFTDSFKNVYINRLQAAAGTDVGETVSASDLIWDWNSRPVIPSNRKVRLPHMIRSRNASGWTNNSSLSSISSSSGSKKGFLSKKVICTLFLTNLFSILIGAGIGIWLSNRGSQASLLEVEF